MESKSQSGRPSSLAPVEVVPTHAEDYYRDLVEHSRDLLCTHDLQGHLLSVNPLPARILGYEADELLKIPMRELVPPAHRPQFDEYLQRVESDGHAEGLLVLMTRNGERRIWEYSNSLRRLDSTPPIVRGVAHDVTARVEAELALRKSEERFRVALKNSPTVVFNQDRELRYTWINAPVLAFAERDAIGLTDSDMLSPEDEPAVTRIKRQVLQSGSGIRSEVSITFRGERYYFDLTVEPLRDRANTVVGITCAATDITALKRAQQEREQLIKELQEALAKVKLLSGLLPTCASCKRIRDEQGQWHEWQGYIHRHSEADFTHGICPDCASRLYPDYFPKE
jgi:PAS domain S-box-containing protein